MLKIGSYFIHKYESKSGETQKMFVCLEGDSDIPSSFMASKIAEQNRNEMKKLRTSQFQPVKNIA